MALRIVPTTPHPQRQLGSRTNRTPGRQPGDAMSSHMLRSLIQLNRSAGQGSEIPALTEDVIEEISNEDEVQRLNDEVQRLNDEVQRLKNGLRKMTSVAQDAGARHAILKETLASLGNADEFINVIVDRRATCLHRCQACGGFYVVIVALISLCFSTVITYYGNPAAALCMPLILSGNPQAYLEYARMQMQMQMQVQMQQCKCGSEVSGVFNVYDIEYDCSQAPVKVYFSHLAQY